MRKLQGHSIATLTGFGNERGHAQVYGRRDTFHLRQPDTRSPGRLDFTVLRGAVNVARRIESLTKSIGHRVLVTAAIAETNP